MKRLGTNTKWCKGCGVCTAFCPKDVLALENEKVIIRAEENCVFCGTCESLCPDFAVFIYEEDREHG